MVVYVAVGSLSLIIVSVLIGVLISVQRKRAYGTQWFPEGFLSPNSAQGTNRRGPDGGEDTDDCKLDGLGMC